MLSARLSRIPLVTLLALTVVATGSQSASAAELLVEAESFESPGGWQLDTQFIEIGRAHV